MLPDTRAGLPSPNFDFTPGHPYVSLRDDASSLPSCDESCDISVAVDENTFLNFGILTGLFAPDVGLLVDCAAKDILTPLIGRTGFVSRTFVCSCLSTGLG